ncbi:hypothetical protein BGX34_012153 [Mortierella sp. NVP85]|nr:hypothetical protein BGX34_012153 [Mortierella sp. NVP85]
MAVDTRSTSKADRKDSSDSSSHRRTKITKKPSPEKEPGQSNSLEADKDSDEEPVLKPTEALNKLFQMFTLTNNVDYELEISGERELTVGDLKKLVESHEERRAKKIIARALLSARLHTAKVLLSEIRLEKSIKEDAQKKLELQKEALSQTLSKEITELEGDLCSLKCALGLSGWHKEDHPTPWTRSEEPNKISIQWNPSILEHDALHRIFKEDYIPLLEGSNEIDYSKVRKKVFIGAPSLDLDMSKVPREDFMTTLVTKVFTFRDEFRRFYEWNLTVVLFDKMAWDYMAGPLTKVNGLANDYLELIEAAPMKERNWSKVAACLHKALRFELLEPSLADEILKTRPKKGENVLEFSQRLRPLMEAVEFSDSCSLLIKALGNHLSDIGFRATIKEYGAFDKIKSMKEYLKFLENTPGAFDGPKTDHIPWLVNKYAGKTRVQSFERQQAHSKKEQDRSSVPRASKRRRFEEQNRDDGHKRPRHESEVDPDICTYSERCKAKNRRHPKEKCFFWMKDNGIPISPASES